MKTLTGKTMQEVGEIMTKVLEPQAYKEVGGASYLTDINPAYLREALTEAFGLCGYGWTFNYSPEHLVIKDQERPEAYLTYSELRFAYMDVSSEVQWSAPVIGQGGSDNRKVGDAIKGAVTQALGKASSMLLWQVEVYKGKVTHRNPTPQTRTEGKKAQPKQEPKAEPASNDPVHKRTGSPLEPNEIKTYLEKKAIQIGDYTANDKFRGFVRGMLSQLFPESQEVDADVHRLLAYIFGVASSKELTGGQVMALRDWIDPAPNDDGKTVPNGIVMAEAQDILKEIA